MIELGLGRISRLLQQTPQTWKAIHVAGTNGKGSICAYLSALIHAHGESCARFNSPHLIDRWDCIVVNEKTVSETEFQVAEQLVKNRNKSDAIGSSEFELLTATAFEIFERRKAQWGLVEVGLGGTLDATNAMKHKAITVISKIGLDHQSFLGNTLEEIALQKAGIMRPGVPCVVDSSNDPSVLEVLKRHARDVGADFVLPHMGSSVLKRLQSTLEPHQLQNLACAHTAFQLAYSGYKADSTSVLKAIEEMKWPGRLQRVDISRLVNDQREVILDGAHNPQSAEVLGAFVDKYYRGANQPNSVNWVLATSDGKDLSGILQPLLRKGDEVIAYEFGPVDGMPWVKPMKTSNLLEAAQACLNDLELHDAGNDLPKALELATRTAVDKPVVVAGSLYLVADLLRLMRSSDRMS